MRSALLLRLLGTHQVLHGIPDTRVHLIRLLPLLLSHPAAFSQCLHVLETGSGWRSLHISRPRLVLRVDQAQPELEAAGKLRELCLVIRSAGRHSGLQLRLAFQPLAEAQWDGRNFFGDRRFNHAIVGLHGFH